jgi:hypothetical protein
MSISGFANRARDSAEEMVTREEGWINQSTEPALDGYWRPDVPRIVRDVSTSVDMTKNKRLTRGVDVGLNILTLILRRNRGQANRQ